MKKYSPLLFMWLFVSVSEYATSQVTSFKRIVVNDENFEATGWQNANPDIVTISIRGAVPDPKWPEYGSVYLKRTDAFNTKPLLLKNKGFDSLELRYITELKYSTYVTNNKTSNNPIAPYPVAPALILQLDITGDYKFDDKVDVTINFYPQVNFIGRNDKLISPVVMNQWQEWDALHGKWRFTPEQKTTIPDFGKNLEYFTLQTLIDYYNSVRNVDVSIVNNIINPDTPDESEQGGIKFVVPPDPPKDKSQYYIGDYSQFEGFVDGFVISTQTIKAGTGAVTGRQVAYDFQFTYKKESGYKLMIIIGFAVVAFVIGTFIYFRKKRKK